MKQILIAEVSKKFEGESEWTSRSTFTSFDLDKLKKKIESHYNIILSKDDEDDFPYFTDGGFKYQAKTESYELRAVAHLYDVIE